MRRRAPLVRRIAGLVAWVVCAQVALDAQTVLFSVTGGANAPATTQLIDLSTGHARVVSTDFTNQAIFSPTGEWLLRTKGLFLQSQKWSFVQADVEVALPDEFGVKHVHPRALAAFGSSYPSGFPNVPAIPARLDSSGLHQWPVCGLQAFDSTDLSTDGQHFYVRCSSGTLVVVDTTSGTVTRAVPLAGSAFAVSADETEAAVVRFGPSGWELARVDLITGQTLAVAPLPLTTVGTYLQAFPDRTALLTRWCDWSSHTPSCGYDVIDFTSLTRVSRFSLGSLPVGFRIDLTPDGRDAFVGDVYGHLAWRVDVRSGQVTGYVEAPTGGAVSVTLAPVPMPASGMSAHVAGRTVTLSWYLAAHSPPATGYRLEVGSRTGLSDLGTVSLGPAGELVATGIPPGRYFVRLRSLNALGESGPSNEVIVDVL